MSYLNKLLGKKAQYEQEKVFLDAKIAVVDELISEESIQSVETPCEQSEEIDEETVQNESY